MNCFIHESARLGLCVVPQIREHASNTKHAYVEIVHCFLDLCEQAGSSGNGSDSNSGGSCFQFCPQHRLCCWSFPLFIHTESGIVCQIRDSCFCTCPLNSLFTDNPVSWPCLVWVTDSFTKYTIQKYISKYVCM